MVGAQFLTLLHATSRSFLLKPSSIKPSFYNPIKTYGQAINGNRSRWIEERAPSTAEEFQRVAEERAREAQQSVASQTVDRSHHGAEEATIGDTKVETAKNRYKDHEPGSRKSD